jgi:hypothetical protein
MASGSIETAFRELVDRYRVQCLWFLREDYYPSTPAEREDVLCHIERHGDLEAFRRVAEIRTWLSQHSNISSAAS